MSELGVRGATPGDAGVIAEIHVEGYEEAFRGLIPDDVIDSRTIEVRRRVWAERLEAAEPDQFVVVVELDGRVVGFASGRAADPDESDDEADGCWENLYLRSSHLASSVGFRAGMALQEEVVRRLRDMGFSQGICFVFDSNRRAQTFFKLMRWLPDGAEREVEGTRQLRHRRSLSPSRTKETTS